eukprot:2251354-Rhodomonas_salina.1
MLCESNCKLGVRVAGAVGVTLPDSHVPVETQSQYLSLFAHCLQLLCLEIALLPFQLRAVSTKGTGVVFWTPIFWDCRFIVMLSSSSPSSSDVLQRGVWGFGSPSCGSSYARDVEFNVYNTFGTAEWRELLPPSYIGGDLQSITSFEVNQLYWVRWMNSMATRKPLVGLDLHGSVEDCFRIVNEEFNLLKRKMIEEEKAVLRHRFGKQWVRADDLEGLASPIADLFDNRQTLIGLQRRNLVMYVASEHLIARGEGI